MSDDNKIKKEVKKKYSQISVNATPNSKCCPSCCGSDTEFSFLNEDYSTIDGYVPEADMKLGCGLPIEYANINSGDVVVDLGCGAGNDVFIARKIVGKDGKVYGIDFTNDMIKRANENLKKLNYDNVFFLYGDIENLPLNDNFADVVISNCVLNLVPDKKKAFSEIYRILKAKGHFSISDVVSTKNIPDILKKIAELYTGCISGTITLEEYVEIIEKAGFKNIKIQSKKKIYIPDDIFLKFITKEELDKFNSSGMEFFSVNLYAEKF